MLDRAVTGERYETRLSAAEADSKVVTALREHLTRARDARLPIRMIVTFPDGGKTGKGGSYHVRPDLTGRIVEFDGDRFVIDFTRPQAASPGAHRPSQVAPLNGALRTRL